VQHWSCSDVSSELTIAVLHYDTWPDGIMPNKDEMMDCLDVRIKTLHAELDPAGAVEADCKMLVFLGVL